VRAKGFGVRILVEARFPVPIQTGPEAHCRATMGITPLYWVVKRPGRTVDHPSPPCVQVKEIVELYLHSLSVPYGMIQSVL
jgi:hypothetical protein